MNRLTKIVTTLRNNWKKSTFALCVISYGVNYGVDKIRTDEMMKGFCEEALSYGRMPLPLEAKPRHITVILNPAAKKKKAKAKFEKFCAPLLHLAGLSVSVVQTEAVGQARGLMEVMSNTDAVAVAGGDGTLSEAVTGLLRRQDAGDAAYQFPLAVLPLGRSNVVAASVFGRQSHEAKHLAEATMALIRGAKKSVDVMKIEAVETEVETKPVYAVAELQWGAYRDVHTRRDKYWFWGPLRAHAAAVFCWPKSDISWQCQAELSYVAPCSGCRQCRGVHLQPEVGLKPSTPASSRWWQAFIPKPSPLAAKHINYDSVENADCGLQHSVQVATLDLSVATSNARPRSQEGEADASVLTVSIGPREDQIGFTEFVKEGWRREDGENPSFKETLTAREVWLRPVEAQKENKTEGAEATERWLSIDQEDFELHPMRITLLPKRISLFCPAEQVAQ